MDKLYRESFINRLSAKRFKFLAHLLLPVGISKSMRFISGFEQELVGLIIDHGLRLDGSLAIKEINFFRD